MRIIMRLALMTLLLILGFAAGFPVGQSRGFSTGSEWAFVQARMFAREAGIFMPVTYEAGQFRITLKQPKHLYRNARLHAERYENEALLMSRGEETLNEDAPLVQNVSLPRQSASPPRAGEGGPR